MAKSWQQKYDDCNAKGPVIKTIDKDMMGMKAGQVMLISTPERVAGTVAEFPVGKVYDSRHLREELAKGAGADVTCPITTGIFLRIVIELEHEKHEVGKPMSELVPFWRVVDEKAPIAKKVSFDLTPYFAQRELEQSALA